MNSGVGVEGRGGWIASSVNSGGIMIVLGSSTTMGSIGSAAGIVVGSTKGRGATATSTANGRAWGELRSLGLSRSVGPLSGK